jgi:homoserine O-acetyltransferase/O-succinyltransferase
MRPSIRPSFYVVSSALLFAAVCHAQSGQTAVLKPTPHEGDYVLHDFRFKSGETLPTLRMHYLTFGKPVRDAAGRVTNAVLILHGTSRSSDQFLAPQFADVLLGRGQPLDTSRYFLIIPDNIGHGKSSKPSDGMRMHFPQYDYDDLVLSQYELLTEGLGVNHLRLILGTSMGCMHSWIWGETYPDFMDAMMPLACLPVPIAGRNHIFRKMVMDGIRQDPGWNHGDYTTEPRAGPQMWVDFMLIASGSPLQMQKNYPTPEAADKYVDDYMRQRIPNLDANDLLYEVNASRSYDPSSKLATITVPVMFVNFADDFINPPELGIAEQEIKKVKRGQFHLIPASEQTHGHFTHTWPVVWQQYLQQLLEESQR